MADFRSRVMIEKPLNEVFDYVACMENAHEIMPNVEKMEKKTEGPIGKGTIFIETRMIRGKKVDADIEFIQFEQGKSFTLRSNSNGLIVEYKYDFHEIEEGTQVELDAYIKTSGFVMGLTKPLLVRMIKREDGNQLKYLKEMLEEAK